MASTVDARGISSVKSQKKCRGIRIALASAVLEWFLICLLFIEAIFSFLITKFASYFELQTPCLLCSRLDHVMGNKKLRYYYDLICRKHKLEISSLVLCHAHDKLVDVHGMCESCLFSFATINKSNAETYRLLVGKLGEGSRFGSNKDPVVKDCSSSTQQCSCCYEPWVPSGYGENLMQTNRVGSGEMNLVPVYDLNKIERSMPARDIHQRSNSEFDHLPHIAYTELKDNSDTESEVLLSDDDINMKARSHVVNPEEDVTVRCVQAEPRIIAAHDDLASEKRIDSVTASQPPVSTSEIQSDVDKVDGVGSVSPTVSEEHGLEDGKLDTSTFPELISLDEVPQSSMTKETPVEVSEVSEHEHNSLDDVPVSLDAKETLEEASKGAAFIPAEDDIPPSSFARKTPMEASESSKLISGEEILSSSDGRGKPGLILTESELVSAADILPSPSAAETPVQGLQESSTARTEDVWQTATTDCEEISKIGTGLAATNEMLTETNPGSGDCGQQAANFLDLGDAYKLAVGSKGRQISGELAEQWIGKDSLRLGEDLKILFSQLSAARDQMMNDTASPKVPVSPKLSSNGDEPKNLDASSSIGIQMLQKRISLERNESGLSLDGSMVSEIEGESAFDRLKRQIEHDKKLLNALLKELEEERNASAISANQALAMITRLQEEKATLQMEALQYLRMMEEQAEYDMEALEKTSDLLSQREKEIQHLEGELQFYRDNPSDPFWGNSKLADTKTISETTSVSVSTLRDADAEKSESCQEVQGRTVSLLDFDDERAYVLQSLKKLENRLCILSDNHMKLVNGEYSENIDSRLELQANRETEKNDDLSTQNHGENSSAKDQDLLLKKSELGGNENNNAKDLDVLADEVSDLNERLKALEADRYFLEHSINSIRNGEEGLKFIQEIASQLKELRRIGTKEREQTIA